jgi:hypothetical protein
MATIEVPQVTIQQVYDRLGIVGDTVNALKKLEPSLLFLNENLEFFKILASTLNGRLSMLEQAVTVGIPAQISHQVSQDKTNLLEQIKTSTLSSVRDELQTIRQTVDDFRRDATANWATKSDLEIVKLGSIGSTNAVTNSKSKVPAPTVFSGKREDWKSFSSHLSLFFTANTSQYPSDTDKILFAISRLGSGSAFKFMEQYIPDFKKPAASRPMIISSYDTFIDTLAENFGIQNAHVVAEAQLRILKQRHSAMDYTNRFLELASETDWNDAAKISQYRLGLKDTVQDILALTDEPTDFATFTSKAINIDKRLYARQVEKNSQNSSRSSSSSAPPTRTQQTHRDTTTQPPTTPSNPPSTIDPAPSMAMDLSHVQHRHIDAAEKQRRRENDLCTYCASKDHWVKDCPTKPKSSSPPAPTSSSSRTNHSISVIHANPVETDDNIVFELV